MLDGLSSSSPFGCDSRVKKHSGTESIRSAETDCRGYEEEDIQDVFRTFSVQLFSTTANPCVRFISFPRISPTHIYFTTSQPVGKLLLLLLVFLLLLLLPVWLPVAKSISATAKNIVRLSGLPAGTKSSWPEDRRC